MGGSVSLPILWEFTLSASDSWGLCWECFPRWGWAETVEPRKPGKATAHQGWLTLTSPSSDWLSECRGEESSFPCSSLTLGALFSFFTRGFLFFSLPWLKHRTSQGKPIATAASWGHFPPPEHCANSCRSCRLAGNLISPNPSVTAEITCPLLLLVSPAISQPLPLKPPESRGHISPLPHLSCFLSCPDLFSAVSVDNQLGSGAVFPEVSYLSQLVGSLIKQKKYIYIYTPICTKLDEKIYTLAAALPGPAKGRRCCTFWGNKKAQAFLSPLTLSLSGQRQSS